MDAAVDARCVTRSARTTLTAELEEVHTLELQLEAAAATAASPWHTQLQGANVTCAGLEDIVSVFRCNAVVATNCTEQQSAACSRSGYFTTD